MSCWHPKGLSFRMWVEEIPCSSETLLASLSGKRTTIPTASLVSLCHVCGRDELHSGQTFRFYISVATEGHTEKGCFNKISYTLFEGRYPLLTGDVKLVYFFF